MSGDDLKTARLALEQVSWEFAPRDVNTFCEYVMQDSSGEPWVQQPFHREWHQLISDAGPGGRVLIAAPREHAKSTQISVGRVLWELGRDPNLRIKLVASNDDLARDLLYEVRANIEHNPRLHAVFPELQPDEGSGWSKQRLYVRRARVQKDPSLEAAGILTSGVGGRADLIIFDDVVDLRNAIHQPAMREQVKRAFYEVWMNLPTEAGRAIYVATVWHGDDLTAELAGRGHHRRSRVWRVWWKPARDPASGQVLWPGSWSPERLARKKEEIGPRAFARQYELVPLSEEEALFPERILQVCLDKGKGLMPDRVEVPEQWPRFIGVDLASSLQAKSAYTVAFVIALDPDGIRYPLQIHRARLAFDQTVELIGQLWRQHHPQEIRVENNAYQDALVQHLRQRFPGIPVVGYTTGRQKVDEKVGLPGLSAKMAAGGWVIPSGGDPHPADCPCPWCAWVAELRSYPMGRYSDIVMAMWFANAAAEAEVDRFAESFQLYVDTDFR